MSNTNKSGEPATASSMRAKFMEFSGIGLCRATRGGAFAYMDATAAGLFGIPSENATETLRTLAADNATCEAMLVKLFDDESRDGLVFEVRPSQRSSGRLLLKPVQEPGPKSDTVWLTVLDVSGPSISEAVYLDMRHRMLFEQCGQGIAYVDTSGTIREANDILLEILGISRQEFVGKNLFELVEPFGADPEDVSSAFIKDLTNDEPLENEWRIRPKGRDIHLASRAYLDKKDGVPCGLTIFVSDITPRVSAEGELKTALGKFELALRNADMGFWEWDIIKREIKRNKILDEILEISPTVDISDFKIWLDKIHPDDLNTVLGAISDHVQGRSAYFDVEFRFKANSGVEKWIQTRGHTYERDAAGNPTKMIGTSLDTTSRRHTLQEIDNRLQFEEIISNFARELANTSDWKSPMPAMLERLRKAFDTTRGLVVEIIDDPAHGTCMKLVLESKADEVPTFYTLNNGIMPFAQVSDDLLSLLQSGQGKWGTAKEFPDKDRAALESMGVKSVIIMPIYLQNHLWGLIGIDDGRKDKQWKDEDVHVLRTIARIIGNAIHREQMEKLMMLQRDLSIKVGALTDLDSALDLYIDAAVSASGLEAAGIYIKNSGGDYELIACKGISESFSSLMHRIAADHPYTSIVMDDKPAYLNHHELLVSRTASEALKKEGLRCLAVLPVMNEGKVFAALLVSSRSQKEVPMLSRGPLEAISAQFGSTLARLLVEQALRQSENTLRSIFEASRNVSFIITDAGDEDISIIEFSPGAENIFGYKREEVIGKPVAMLHVQEDVEKFPESHQAMRERKRMKGFDGEALLLRKNGERFTGLFSTYPLFDDDGNMYAALGVTLDISGYKEIENRLRQMSKKLVSLQENERSRISRELHDSLGQQLASIILELQLVKQQKRTGPKSVKNALEMTRNVSRELKLICKGLYPVTLKRLGLLASLEILLNDFSELTDFRVFADLAPFNEELLPYESSINMYRVVQEALSNSAKHSKASFIRVTLSAEDWFLKLEVSDDGIGFDMTAQGFAYGLGLMGMAERAELCNGALEITSAPDIGTKIVMRVPVRRSPGMAISD